MNYDKKRVKKLVEDLKNGIAHCEKDEGMDKKNWPKCMGILISGNDAKYILWLMETLATCKKPKHS